mmetsp:Transcript_110982/g.196585  ORF Transcript_110982/g.196585 Transcript_110982/m.196585 type:complete len:166 (+) Transcript_110982:57-554(+)
MSADSVAPDSGAEAAAATSEPAPAASVIGATAPAAGEPVRPPVVAPASSDGDSQAEEEQPGLPGRVARGIGRLGYRIFDNMSFVGEVLVEWLELDKPRFHEEIKRMRKEKRREERLRKQREAAEAAAEVAVIEEADAPTAAPTDQTAPGKATDAPLLETESPTSS